MKVRQLSYTGNIEHVLLIYLYYNDGENALIINDIFMLHFANINQLIHFLVTYPGSIICIFSPQPFQFGNFAKKSAGWECDTCLVANKAEANKCVACEMPKPGAKPPTGKTFNRYFYIFTEVYVIRSEELAGC